MDTNQISQNSNRMELNQFSQNSNRIDLNQLSQNSNRMDINQHSQNSNNNSSQNYYLDNSYMINNKQINNNNSSNVNNIMKALKETGNFQLLQNFASKVTSSNSNNPTYNSSSNHMNNSMNHEPEMGYSNIKTPSLQNYQNMNLQKQYMNNKAMNPNISYSQTNSNSMGMMKSGMNSMNNSQKPPANSQTPDDDIMNSFNLNNNYN